MRLACTEDGVTFSSLGELVAGCLWMQAGWPLKELGNLNWTASLAWYAARSSRFLRRSAFNATSKAVLFWSAGDRDDHSAASGRDALKPGEDLVGELDGTLFPAALSLWHRS